MENQNLELKQITVGRLNTNDICLDYTNVTRQHACVTVCSPTVFLIEDLDSKHGTFVNGERIKRKLLADNDTVTIATHQHTLKSLLAMAHFTTGSTANRNGKNPLDYTQEFEDMKKLYMQYRIFQSEEVNIQNAIRLANERLRLGGALAAPTLALITVLLSGPAIVATISACGLGMLIPAIGSKFLKEDEKIRQPRLHFTNSWRCPCCSERVNWYNKSWEQMAKQKHCTECKAIWIK